MKPTPKPDMTKQGIFPWTKEEKAYIIRAVKSHEAMKAALKNLVARNLIKDTDGDHYQEVLDALKEAE